MALSNGSTDTNTIWLDIKGLKEKDPHFSQYISEGESKRFTNVSGFFKDIQFTEREINGETVEEVAIKLTDGGETYIIKSFWTRLSRSIVNSLCSKESIGIVELSLYVNKNGYPTCSITIDGERPEWKFSLEEQKKLTTFTEYKGKNLGDYSKFEKKLKDLAVKIKSNPDAVLESVVGKTEAPTKETTAEKEEEDFPFD